MLDFMGAAFKGLFTFLIIIAFIGIFVFGIMSLSNSLMLALLIWIGGSISLILTAGLVSIFISMKDNLDTLNYNMALIKDKILRMGDNVSNSSNLNTPKSNISNTSVNNNTKKCTNCNLRTTIDNFLCPKCGGGEFIF